MLTVLLIAAVVWVAVLVAVWALCAAAGRADRMLVTCPDAWARPLEPRIASVAPAPGRPGARGAQDRPPAHAVADLPRLERELRAAAVLLACDRVALAGGRRAAGGALVGDPGAAGPVLVASGPPPPAVAATLEAPVAGASATGPGAQDATGPSLRLVAERTAAGRPFDTADRRLLEALAATLRGRLGSARQSRPDRFRRRAQEPVHPA